MEYADIKWVEGQPYSEKFGDVYYSASDGLSETEHVFIQQNNLIERFKQADRFIIAEAGFGTGLNFIATCRQWLEHASHDSVLSYVGIEKHPVSPLDIRRVSDRWAELTPLYTQLLTRYPPVIAGSHLIKLFNGRVQLNLEFLDIDEALKGCRFKADVWFLDGFNPAQNTDMWNDVLIDKIAQHSKVGTSLSTYTAAGHVRRRLEDAGFEVKKVKGHARKREMITAAFVRESQYKIELPWYEIPQQSCNDKTAIIVGAGIAGLTTALAMINKGWQVTLIDRHDEVAQEASGNPAGVLLPRMNLGDELEQQFFVNAFLFATSQLDDLQKQSSVDFWHKTGVCSQELKEKAEKILSSYRTSQGFVCEGEGALGDEVAQEYMILKYASAGWVNIDVLCREIYKMIEKRISYIRSNINSLNRVEERWQVSDENSILASASVVVLAAGQSIADFELTSWLPVKSIRGQMTAVEPTEKSKKISSALSFGRFVTPQHNGVHYIGASYDTDDMSPELSELSQTENLKKLQDQLPDVFVKPDKLTGRVGFRSVSEDRMPVVGLVPEKEWFLKQYADLRHGRRTTKYLPARSYDGLYLNGAHGSRGLTSCFISAELLLSIIEGTPYPMSADAVNALNPSRFLIRRLKRDQKMTA